MATMPIVVGCVGSRGIMRRATTIRAPATGISWPAVGAVTLPAMPVLGGCGTAVGRGGSGPGVDRGGSGPGVGRGGPDVGGGGGGLNAKSTPFTDSFASTAMDVASLTPDALSYHW